MSLSLALNTALSGLSVNQKSLSVLSQNIANANNKEYSRKVITQEAIYLQGTGAGVSIQDVSRKVDAYLQKSSLSQGSIYGRSEVLSDYSDKLQALLGNPGSQNSIYSYATSFFNAAQSLSESPENAALRINAVNMGQSAARAMNTLASSVYDLQYASDQEIRQAIDTVNTNLREIYTLNATISTNKLLGRPTSELEDRRDTMLTEISSFMDIQTYTQNDGVVNVFTANGNGLVDTNLHQLSYDPAPSSDFFANENATNPILIHRLDGEGNYVGQTATLVTSGLSANVSTVLTSGRIKGLLEVRDQQLPAVLQKLDMLASTMRDEINAVHNTGVAYPGANSYTGTRLVGGDDNTNWTGQVRIAVLGADGQPVPSSYDDETTGARPLLIDLETLNSGNSPGYPTTQGIIDEINRYYGVPQNKVELGNLNNIQLVLNNDSIPGITPQLDFDFKLDNISGSAADFYVTGIQVLDDTDTDITSITQNVPTINLATTGTYVTTADSSEVTVKTLTAHGFSEGDIIYLAPPPSDVDGIAASTLGGFFTITDVTATGFTVSVAQKATSGGSHDRSGVTARESAATAQTGTNLRTTENGNIVVGIGANTTSRYYTVKASVAVADAEGHVSTSIVTYRIDNLASNTRNYPYAARSASGSGTVVAPNTTQPLMTAKLVDANGAELAIVNNQYTTNETGYLKLTAGNSSYVIAIDSLNSVERGKPNSSPVVAGTERSFSHYFELNNFFKENRTTGVMDDDKGSAVNMQVADALVRNPNLIAMGKMVQSPQPANSMDAPNYTYARNIGNNSVIAALAAFNSRIVQFGAAGDLGNTSLSLSAYAGQMISTTSTRAATNRSEMNNAKLLLDGFTERSDSVRGVNLDEELANTIIYQNAYSASARIITVANQFFEALMEAMR